MDSFMDTFFIFSVTTRIKLIIFGMREQEACDMRVNQFEAMNNK